MMDQLIFQVLERVVIVVASGLAAAFSLYYGLKWGWRLAGRFSKSQAAKDLSKEHN